MGVLRVLGPDQSTVLWDFDDSTGAANPSTVITNLAAPLDLGSIDPALALELRTHGAAILGSPTLPTVEMHIPFMASAATDTALFEGLGQLYRYLLSASRDHPIYLDWTELSATRYIDVVGISEMPQLLRGQAQAGIVAGRKSSLGPLTLVLLRQPWMRLATVTTSNDTVDNDPTVGTPDGCRIAPLTVTGDLPTPGRVRVTMDAGAAVERILLGHRARKSRASTYFSEALTDTAFFQCESSGRNWTITLGTNTSSTADANASGGNMARCTHATDPTVWARRVRATRTASLDSMRGSWDVWLRVKGSEADDYRIQLKWGPSATADPPAFVLPEVSHDLATGAPSAFGYVEINLGRIDLPDTVALGGLALEIWTRNVGADTSNLDMDLVWFTPTDTSTIVIPPGGASSQTGAEMFVVGSPPYKLTADATWVAGTVLGDAIRLNAVNEGVGTETNAGGTWGGARHRVRFDLDNSGEALIGTVVCRVVSVTGGGGGAVMASNTQVMAIGYPSDVLLEFDGVGGDEYQAQVVITSYTAGSLRVNGITRETVPVLASGESARTEPGPRRYGVDRLDGSANLAGYLSCEGEVPVLLEPGENHLFIRCDEVALAGYAENENDLARAPIVTVNYDPRMAL